MIIIIADVDEVAALLDMDEPREPEIIPPQTSGPCVHYDEQTEYAADADPCTYPYGDGTCPHLDNPDIICPGKDACYAMRDITWRREACEAEQGHRDADAATGCGSRTRCTEGRPAKLSGISRRRRTTSSRSTGCLI